MRSLFSSIFARKSCQKFCAFLFEVTWCLWRMMWHLSKTVQPKLYLEVSLPLVVEFEVGGTPVSKALTIFSVCWWSTRVELTGAKKRSLSPQAAEIEAGRINRYGLLSWIFLAWLYMGQINDPPRQQVQWSLISPATRQLPFEELNTGVALHWPRTKISVQSFKG